MIIIQIAKGLLRGPDGLPNDLGAKRPKLILLCKGGVKQKFWTCVNTQTQNSLTLAKGTNGFTFVWLLCFHNFLRNGSMHI